MQRDRYNKEKKKMRDSKNSGVGCDEVYTPKWPMYKILNSMLSKCSENARFVNMNHLIELNLHKND